MQRLEREPLLGEQSRPFYGLFRSQPSGSGDWPEVESSSTSSAAQSVVSGASDDRHPPPGTLTLLLSAVVGTVVIWMVTENV